MAAPAPLRVDLTNCDAEPIHITGAVQPHGALLAFTMDGAVVARSENAGTMLGLRVLDPEGAHTDGEDGAAALAGLDALAALGESVRAGLAPLLQGASRKTSFDALIGAGDYKSAFDVTAHARDGIVIVEFEPRDPMAPPREAFALSAQGALERIQQQESLDTLLETATQELAVLTGFDRVMAYRFHDDMSGEVVVERRQSHLVSYLGQRYPASDIPAQARRLFVANPLRLIVDVGYTPVPLVPDRNPVTRGPIDLSNSVLRSVSPIHVEYLGNMGVFGSMSVSLVVGGALWGMFACHHYAPRFVPHAVRMSAQLLAQVVSVMVERFVSAAAAERHAKQADVRSILAARARAEESLAVALTRGAPDICTLVPCDAAVVIDNGEVQTIGQGLTTAAAVAAIDALAPLMRDGLFVTDRLHDASPDDGAAPGDRSWGGDVAGRDPALRIPDGVLPGFAGVLAMSFDDDRRHFVLWLRREQVETVRWAGRPDDKGIAIGPNGPRLSPRGSFDEWVEEIRGRSASWTRDEIAAARLLRQELHDIMRARLGDALRARDMLIATLGHDLRSPLQAITMSAEALDPAGVAAGITPRVQRQLKSSSTRMSRLISNVLDASLLSGGVSLPVVRRPVELSALLVEQIDEAKVAHPGVAIDVDVAPLGVIEADPERISQILSNLLSNARHHGTPGSPVRVVARRADDVVTLEVVNSGAPLPADIITRLDQPFRPRASGASANRGGLGLGLYIVHNIVREHGGTLAATSGDGVVTFTVRLPVV